MKDSIRVGVDGAAMTPVSPDVSIIIPTYNEAKNVALLIGRLEQALATYGWEAVFVDDDSPDGTAQVILDAAKSKPYIRCIQRVGRRGLSSAVIEGVLSSTAPHIVVMDADLQHDETILPAMLRALGGGSFDMAIGSRYVHGGGFGQCSGLRRRMSRLATRVSRLLISAPLHDPMSGFFAMRRPAFVAALENLSGTGYKILLDVLASSPRPLRFVEVPYEFRPRIHGESKLSAKVLLDYVVMIAQKKAGALVRRS